MRFLNEYAALGKKLNETRRRRLGYSAARLYSTQMKMFFAICLIPTLVLAVTTESVLPARNAGGVSQPGVKGINADELPAGGAVILKPESGFVPGGCGFRKALGGLVKVYEICFFGKNLTAKAWDQVFADGNGSKAIKLKLNFVRGVGGKKVSAAFSEALSKSPSNNKLEELERQKFIGWAAKLKIEKDSVMVLTFEQNYPLTVNFFQQAKNVANPENFKSNNDGLGKSVAGIWLGPKPLNEDLKAALLKD